MDFLDYMQMSAGQKFAYKFKTFFKTLPSNIGKVFTLFGQKVIKLLNAIAKGFANYGRNFVKGDIFTKLSYIIMGAGSIGHKQIVKGILYLVLEVLYFLFMIGFAVPYGLSQFFTLGTVETHIEKDTWGVQTEIQGDNSMHILLISVMAMIVTIAFFVFYLMNIKSAIAAQETIKAGKKPIGIKRELLIFLDERFHITLLSLPVALILCFTVLPIIFTVFIAFTNYDQFHQAPQKLFTWIGFKNFADVFYDNPEKSYTFGKILGWTIVWAFFATFTNYIGGMVLALLINKKGIKFKGLWRTLFVITIAVPNFVTLLVMNQLLADQGTLNLTLKDWGLISDSIPFLSDANYARVVVILVNMWIGVPYTMLSTSGILMNIPEDLYESAKIDGANAFQTFMKITLPYMLFVTTPYLISSFVGNINNFNVIYLLTGGEPKSTDYYSGAGKTDLLVTWLYKLTANNKDYNLAAVIGIIIFVICAIASLITYNMSKSAKDEEAFG